MTTQNAWGHFSNSIHKTKILNISNKSANFKENSRQKAVSPKMQRILQTCLRFTWLKPRIKALTRLIWQFFVTFLAPNTFSWFWLLFHIEFTRQLNKHNKNFMDPNRKQNYSFWTEVCCDPNAPTRRDQYKLARYFVFLNYSL